MGAQLLIDEPPLVVLPSLAVKLGSVNRAIVLQQIHYWCLKSTNIRDGHRWVYKTYEEWAEQFPWISGSGIKSVITWLESNGYLISGRYNKVAFDKTKWYRINYPSIDETLTVPSMATVSSMGQPLSDDETLTVPSEETLTDQAIPETTETTTENWLDRLEDSAPLPMEERAPRERQSAGDQRAKSTPPSPAPAPDVSQGMRRFQRQYPSHRSACSSRDLLALWSPLTTAEREEATAALIRWKGSEQWTEENGKFIPGIKRFLEEEMWRAAPAPKPTSSGVFNWADYGMA